MLILVINSGSSSLKYQLFQMPQEKLLAKGLIDKISFKNGSISHKSFNSQGKEIEKTYQKDIQNHEIGFHEMVKNIIEDKNVPISKVDNIDIVGHRVVHGGEFYKNSVLIDKKVIKAIKDCEELAPLHNPPNRIGIQACEKYMPKTPQIAVFDTAFHQTMEPENFRYAIPNSYYKKYKIRRYGFHGTSHKYVYQKACEILKKRGNAITCHIGNGASITAIRDGKVVETSMGFTPLAGLIMGTRSGDIDPSVITYIQKKEGLKPEQIDEILNQKSGLLGIFEKSNHMQLITQGFLKKDPKATLAFQMFVNAIAKYIGSYCALLGKVDSIVFTGGTLEKSCPPFAEPAIIREKIVEKLAFLGIKIDKKKNTSKFTTHQIISGNSKTKVIVIPTNEELMIAKECWEIIKN